MAKNDSKVFIFIPSGSFCYIVLNIERCQNLPQNISLPKYITFFNNTPFKYRFLDRLFPLKKTCEYPCMHGSLCFVHCCLFDLAIRKNCAIANT